MIAEIISVGDELLTGQVINSNGTWLAGELHKAGIDTRKITVVSDKAGEITGAMLEAESKSDLVIVTGGLGPTNDDNTRQAICDFLNTCLVENTCVLDNIRLLFEKRGMEVTETNRKQALIPKSCRVIQNQYGTAPGLMFERNNKLFFALPGVPFEFKPMVTNEIIPLLKKHIKNNFIVHKTILTHGIGESFLADKISDWEGELPSNIKLSYLSSPCIVRLRLSGKGKDQKHVKKDIDKLVKKLKMVIPDYVFGEDNDTMQSVVGELLKKREASVSVAESCTGGMISHLITSVGGASQYYTGGIIAYDNDIKINCLKVDRSLIKKHGAVSKHVAESMAIGVKKYMQTDYAIATTGIAGPEGGTPDKPVGLVWIAVAKNDNVVSKKYIFGNNRERNILIGSITALNMLRKEIMD